MNLDQNQKAFDALARAAQRLQVSAQQMFTAFELMRIEAIEIQLRKNAENALVAQGTAASAVAKVSQP